MKRHAIISVMVLLAATVQAKVDLVTLPTRDTVQLTIYNSADLTLVRESRALTLREGANRLQFSWANTLIDPTSLDLLPKAQADKLDIRDLTFPPRVRNLGVWNIVSRTSGKVPVEISYLTSGLAWRAFYLGTLSVDERTMRLEGFVRVTNNSGEDYENAQTRLIVGKVHMLDEIAALAQRPHPYGSPIPMPQASGRAGGGARRDRNGARLDALRRSLGDRLEAESLADKKEIRKEGLSEYFLYTIEGTETIPSGWSKRLPSFEADDVPVVNLYKYEEERYGRSVMRFLSFKNDDAHKLGQTPIPGGQLKVFRAVDGEGGLSYAGQSAFAYIPVGEDVELSLGAVANLVVEPKLMNTRTEQFTFDDDGNVDGWDEVQDWQIEVKNTRDLPVKVEVIRNVTVSSWDLTPGRDTGLYEKVDLDSVKFRLALEARSKQMITYQLTTRHGRRAD
ncbi:MAG: DUF4139 domain-containing protein [Lentisphaerae bacterium]|nr:DUF4139 domain-containing protein [Lentisphaerota bacterium]